MITKTTVAIVLVVVGVAGFGYFFIRSAPSVLAEKNFCNDSVRVTLKRIPIGEAGTSYPIDVVFRENGTPRTIASFDEALVRYLFATAHLQGHTYWPVDGSVPTHMFEDMSVPQDELERINIFVDPAIVSRTGFDTMAACIRNHIADINALFTKVPNPFPEAYRVPFSHMRIGGMTYSRFDAFLSSQSQ